MQNSSFLDQKWRDTLLGHLQAKYIFFKEYFLLLIRMEENCVKKTDRRMENICAILPSQWKASIFLQCVNSSFFYREAILLSFPVIFATKWRFFKKLTFHDLFVRPSMIWRPLLLLLKLMESECWNMIFFDQVPKLPFKKNIINMQNFCCSLFPMLYWCNILLCYIIIRNAVFNWDFIELGFSPNNYWML